MKRRLLKPLAQWTLDDVQALVDERIEEGQRLDYKQELPLAREKERAEVAKDISGMANAQGGLLLYGVSEDESEEPRPEAITPLPRAGQQTRLEDIVDSSVNPRLGYEARTIDAGQGSVLLVRVAPASGGPHMVQSYGQHRYFVRRGTRTVPMTEDEVRTAYDAARSRADTLDELLVGLPLLPRIGRRRSADALRMSSHGFVPPNDGDWLPAVSVVTAPLTASPELVTPTHIRPDAFREPFERYVGGNRRLHSEGRFTLDAFGLVDEWIEANDDPQRPKVVGNRLRIYRQGVCEWAHRYAFSIPEPFAIPSTAFAQDVHNALAYFASVYDTVGYAGPLAVFIRIDDADKAWLSVSQQLTDLFGTRTEAGVEAVVAYRETTVDTLLADPLPLVRDAMQLIWQAFGQSTCLLFDANGAWVPTR